MKTILKQDKDCIRLLLVIDDRIPSVNSIYEFNRRTGAIYKSQLANKIYQMIQKQITLSGIVDFMPEFIKGHQYFKTKYQFVVRYGFETRDLSNMLKLVEDAIHRKLGIDDHSVVELECVKSLMTNTSRSEFIIFEIQPSNFDTRFFENKSNEI
jgi:Holliday junction resolvase RusA-like endonuclease